MKFFKIFLFFFLISNFSFAEEFERKKPLIITSINPLYQILLAITEDKNNSILIINPNFSEHDYQLKKSDLEFFSKADLIFYIDDNLETNFPKLIKNFSAEKKSYQLSAINDLKLLTQKNNPQKNDVHIWLNPENAIKIAEFMTQKISAIDPKNSQKYQKNFEKFRQETLITAEKIKAQLSKITAANYVFYYDCYQYFADYFLLSPLKIITDNHDRELTVKDVRELDRLVKSKRLQCILGDLRDEKNSAMKLAIKYDLKFSILDAIGVKENFSKRKNGYNILLFNLAANLFECADKPRQP